MLRRALFWGVVVAVVGYVLELDLGFAIVVGAVGGPVLVAIDVFEKAEPVLVGLAVSSSGVVAVALGLRRVRRAASRD